LAGSIARKGFFKQGTCPSRDSLPNQLRGSALTYDNFRAGRHVFGTRGCAARHFGLPRFRLPAAHGLAHEAPRDTRDLQAALEDESGARDRAALLLAIASAVNSSLALEEVLNVALTHAGRIMGAVAGAMYLVQPGKTDMKREVSTTSPTALAAPSGRSRRSRCVPPSQRCALVVKLDERTAPGIEGAAIPARAGRPRPAFRSADGRWSSTSMPA